VRIFEPVGPHSMSSKSIASYVLILAHLGFFIYECGLQTYYDIQIKSFSRDMQIHHLTSLLVYLMCAYFDTNHHFGCFTFILEMVAPVNCIRWVLKKANKKNTFAWKLSNLLYIHLFHTRTILECLIAYETIKYRDDFIRAPPIQYLYHIFCMVLFLFYLTPYWTFVVTKDYYKQFLQAELEENKSKSD
jgi:hypothetical protein